MLALLLTCSGKYSSHRIVFLGEKVQVSCLFQVGAIQRDFGGAVHGIRAAVASEILPEHAAVHFCGGEERGEEPAQNSAMQD